MVTREKPRQVVYTPVDVDDAEYAEFTREATEEELDFEKFRDEMREANQYAKITVSRQPTTSDGRPGQQKLIFLFECGMDEFSFSQLCSRCRDEYGTGTYRIQARNEQGQLKINKAIQVEVPKTDATIDGSNPAEIITRFSEAMHQHQNRTEQMMAKFIAPQTGGDAFNQMTQMMTAMGGMMGAMGLKPIQPQAPKTMLEIMTEFKMMKELFGDSDGGGGEANLYSLLTATMQSFGGPIAAAIAAGQTDGSVNPQGLLENPKPAPSVDQEKIKQEQETEALKGQIKILVANAEAQTDPVQMATLIVEKTPEENLDSLFEFLSGDDYLDQMIFLVPEVKAHENWFRKLRDTVIELLTEPEEPPIVPESEPDDPAETVAGNDKPTDADISDETDGDASTDTGGGAGN